MDFESRMMGVASYAIDAALERFAEKAKEAQSIVIGDDVFVREKALMLACEEIADMSGTCPFDQHELYYRKWKKRCEERCSSDVDMSACWMDYLMERSAE